MHKCAFIIKDNKNILFVEGENVSPERAALLVREGFGIDVTVRRLERIPRDVKHHTKIYYKKL